MLGSVIDQPLIYLVGDDHQVVAQDDVGQPLQGLLRQHAAGGVVGGDDHNGPGLGGDLGLDLLQVQLIAVFLPQFVSDRDGVEHTGHVDVVQPHRVGDQNLVSLVQNAGQGHLQRLAAAGSGVDVRLLQVDAQVGVGALHRRQKLRHAGGRRIGQHWVLEILHRVKEGLGRLNVRLADIQMIDLAALGLCRQLIGQKLPHGRELTPLNLAGKFHKKDLLGRIL